MSEKSFKFSLNSIASRLTQVKEFLHVTSKQLAESAGVTEQTFSAWFKGKNPPTAEALAAWSVTYNLNTNWLLTGEGEPFGGMTSTLHGEDSIDEHVLFSVVEMLEEVLNASKNELAPSKKAAIICNIYALINNNESITKRPAIIFRLINEAVIEDDIRSK